MGNPGRGALPRTGRAQVEVKGPAFPVPDPRCRLVLFFRKKRRIEIRLEWAGDGTYWVLGAGPRGRNVPGRRRVWPRRAQRCPEAADTGAPGAAATRPHSSGAGKCWRCPCSRLETSPGALLPPRARPWSPQRSQPLCGPDGLTLRFCNTSSNLPIRGSREDAGKVFVRPSTPSGGKRMLDKRKGDSPSPFL